MRYFSNSDINVTAVLILVLALPLSLCLFPKYESIEVFNKSLTINSFSKQFAGESMSDENAEVGLSIRWSLTPALHFRECPGGVLSQLSCDKQNQSKKAYVRYFSDFTCQHPQSEEIVFSNPEFCSIDGVKLNYSCVEGSVETRKVLWFTQKQNLFYTETFGLIERPQNPPFLCKGLNCNDCELGQCNGSQEFCQLFKCVDSECFCSMRKPEFILQTDQGSFTPQCLGIENVKITSAMKEHKGVAKRSSGLFISHCVDGNVIISRLSSEVKRVKFCLEPECFVMSFESDVLKVPLSIEQRANNYLANIEVFANSSSPIDSMKIECKETCPVINCYVCLEAFLNISCTTNVQKAILFFEVFILALFLCILLSIIVMALRIVGLLFLPIRMILSMLKKMCRPVNRRRFRVVGKQTFFYFLHLLSLVITCSDITTFSLQSDNCIKHISGNTTCSIDFKTKITISPIGQDSCFSILKSDGLILGSLLMTTENLKLRCNKQTLYYTFEPSVECSSLFSCYLGGHCAGDYPCSTNISAIFGKEGTGKTLYGCERASGCAGNGCWLCVDSCIFYKADILNKQSTYTVSNCPSWEFMVTLSVKYIVNGEVRAKTINLTPGIKERFEGFTLSLTSISVPPSVLTSMCFVTDGSSVSMLPCNGRNELTKGKIGEIQCPSKRHADSASSQCVLDKATLQVQRHSQSVSCSLSVLDIKTIFHENLLPLKVGSKVLSSSQDEIYLLETWSSLFEAQIEAKDVTLTPVVDGNKCFISFKSLEGCYDCETGSVLTLEGRTNFGSATASVICPSLVNPVPVLLRESPHVLELRVHFSLKEINEECVVSCPDSRSTIIVYGVLMAVEKVATFKTITGTNNFVKHSALQMSYGLSFFSLLDYKTVILLMLMVFVCYILFRVIQSRSQPAIVLKSA